MSTRERKLAELAELAVGMRWGLAAFVERADEMGPGVPARGSNGRSAKGSHSDPTEAEAARPAVTATTKYDRLLDRAYAAMLDLEAEYRAFAQPIHGVARMGEPSCVWCDAAAQAKHSPTPEHRCRPYLHAKFRDGNRIVKALVCEWCYRFTVRHDRRPTVEELWAHAQGRRVYVRSTKVSA